MHKTSSVSFTTEEQQTTSISFGVGRMMEMLNKRRQGGTIQE